MSKHVFSAPNKLVTKIDMLIDINESFLKLRQTLRCPFLKKLRVPNVTSFFNALSNYYSLEISQSRNKVFSFRKKAQEHGVTSGCVTHDYAETGLAINIYNNIIIIIIIIIMALFILGLKSSNNLQQFKYKNEIFYRDIKNLKENKPKI